MPPFYYGTHYSTMGAVLHWLVRVVSREREESKGTIITLLLNVGAGLIKCCLFVYC